jgi:hypothetical protein
MPSSLRDAWRRTVRAGDYDAFMAEIGQAQANARLVREFLSRLSEGSRVLVAGAGTGQMFDFENASMVARHRVLFSDLNPSYLGALGLRLRHVEGWSTVADDVEQSALRGSFDAAVAVLVLEHVDWRKALATLTALAARLFLVMQVNPAGMGTAVAPGRTPPASMSVFAGEAPPHLLDAREIGECLQAAGYACVRECPAAVADGKTMLGLEWARADGRFVILSRTG